MQAQDLSRGLPEGKRVNLAVLSDASVSLALSPSLSISLCLSLTVSLFLGL